MKIPTEELKNALLRLKKVVPTKVSFLTLPLVKVEIKNDRINFFSTDLSLQVRSTIFIPSQYPDDLSFVVDFKLFDSVVTCCLDDFFEISVETSLISLKWGKNKFKLPFIEQTEFFTDWNDYLREAKFLSSYDFRDFLEPLSYVSRFASKETTASIFTAVNIYNTGEDLKFYGTDRGKVLSQYSLPNHLDFPKSISLPADSIKVIESSLRKGSESEVNFYSGGLFEVRQEDQCQIIGRLVLQEYPKCYDLIPQDFNYLFTAEVDKIKNVLTYVAPFSSYLVDKVVKILFDPSDPDILRITSSTPNGDLDVELPIASESFKNSKLEIYLQYDYLLLCLKFLNKNSLATFKFIDSQSPVLLCVENILHLIMPKA